MTGAAVAGSQGRYAFGATSIQSHDEKRLHESMTDGYIRSRPIRGRGYSWLSRTIGRQSSTCRWRSISVMTTSHL
jgi:hypothetical protein